MCTFGRPNPTDMKTKIWNYYLNLYKIRNGIARN